jgi:hypothetical protein
MRLFALAVLLTAAAPVLAGGPEVLPDGTYVLRLKVGHTKDLSGGTGPICDNPAVAVISSDGKAILTAVGPGETLCSVTNAFHPGWRTIYKVIVER